MFFILFMIYGQQHLLWWLIYSVQEVFTFVASGLGFEGGCMAEMRYEAKEGKLRKEAMLGERKSSMSRSRVVRGHFTLMAARPIETTAALHDLKVRRQRIIFQCWWSRTEGIRCGAPTIPPNTWPPHPSELLQPIQDGMNKSQNFYDYSHSRH